MKITHTENRQLTLLQDMVNFIKTIDLQSVEKYFISTTPSGITRIFHVISKDDTSEINIYSDKLSDFFQGGYCGEEWTLLNIYSHSLDIRSDVSEMLATFGLENSPSLEIEALTLSPKGVDKDV